jgi:2-polyprenyl-3-methyl-5-hydroxy-6-metoxy-1,4-benzoquinol methylase
MNEKKTNANETKSLVRILDLGCGMNPHERANIVIDLNPIINQLPANIEKHIYDLNELPYPFDDCSIDEIYCMQVLEHLTIHTFEFLTECYRILKPDGTLHLQLPNAFFVAARLRFLFGSYVSDTSFHPFHSKLLKPTYVKQHLRYLGFSIRFLTSPRSRILSALQRLLPDLFCRGIYIVATKRP